LGGREIPVTDSPSDFNRAILINGLDGCLDAVNYVIQNALEGQFDESGDYAFLIELTFVFDHLFRTWHLRKISPNEFLNESQEDFEEMTSTIVNWGGVFRLVEIKDINRSPLFSICRTDDPWYAETSVAVLRRAEGILQNMISSLENGRTKALDLSGLKQDFASVLRNICLAWHVRHCSPEEFAGLLRTKRETLETTIPKLYYRYRLVDAED
jgi:hypothetical protein